ncbi:MAG: DUF5343 domain-containing protein [Patescibacteria group bacterium]|nr:DUF5343 domain-containing protein [Patescibacteria group bacterium]
MEENIPYVSSYAQLPQLFNQIQAAAVPTKFTQEFMRTILGLKSSNFFPMIPFLKRLGFIDSSNVPTQEYRDYRDNDLSKAIMANCVRKSYAKLFQTNEFAHKLTKDELLSKVKTITGLPETHTSIPRIVSTFMELVKLSDFDAQIVKKEPEVKQRQLEEEIVKVNESTTKLGISYTINLNLPPTTDIEVFNAIFKSLKEHILHD